MPRTTRPRLCGISTTQVQYDYIEARRSRINQSVSGFLQPLIDQWFKEGCPNLHEIEKRFEPIPVPANWAPVAKR